MADICSAVVSSMEQTPLTSNDLNQQALNDQVNDRRNSSASSSSSSAISTQEGAQPSPLAAVSITNIVDDEPAPRSEVGVLCLINAACVVVVCCLKKHTTSC